MQDWKIQSRAHACEACERSFEDKEPYHTILVEEGPELKRTDVCKGCWEESYQDEARGRAGFVSCWQGIYEAPPPASEEPIKKENAESLLRKLTEQGDPNRIPACYILAVMLERKRLLKVKEQLKRDGQRVFIYEQPKTGDLFTIIDPDLQLDQLEQVQRDVADLLEHGLSAAAGEPTETGLPGEAGGQCEDRELPEETAVAEPAEATDRQPDP